MSGLGHGFLGVLRRCGREAGKEFSGATATRGGQAFSGAAARRGLISYP